MTIEEMKIKAFMLSVAFLMIFGSVYLDSKTTSISEDTRQQESFEMQEQVLKAYNNMVSHHTTEPEGIKETTSFEPVTAELETVNESQWQQSEMDLLLRCVEAEAGNQSLDGRRMVADVILNRVRDPDFPNTIEDVIAEPYRFSSYWDGRMATVTVSELTIKAVEMEIEEVSYPGLFYFTAEGYSHYGTPWRKIGDHYFSLK